MGVIDSIVSQGSGMIAGTMQSALGLGQLIAGLSQKKPEVPDYDIPQEVYENMTDAEYWSFQGLPESQKQSFVERSQRGTSTALSRSSERKGGLGIVAGAAQTEQDASMDLLNADVTQRMDNLKTFWGMRDKMTTQKEKKQAWNMQKVTDRRAEIDALRGAGVQNMMSGMGTMAGISDSSETTTETTTEPKSTVEGGWGNDAGNSGINTSNLDKILKV